MEVLRAEEAGGAAAEVEGLEGGIFKWLQIPLNPPLRKWETTCFLQDSLDVVGDGGLAVGEGIEVAVAAFPNAERDMDVETFQSTPPVRPDPSTTFGMTRTSLLHFKEQEKRFLWDFYRADHLHLFLAFGLLFEQFALAGDIAAVAFC